MNRISQRELKKAYFGKGEYRCVVPVVAVFKNIVAAADAFPEHCRAKCSYPNGCVIFDMEQRNAELKIDGSRYFFEFPEKVEYVN